MPIYQLKCVMCGAPMGEGFLPYEGVLPDDPRLCPYRCGKCHDAWVAAGYPATPTPPLPTSSHVIPPSGKVGDKVLVIGALESDSICFGGVRVTEVETAPTGVLATVPASAVSGPVTVDTGFVDEHGTQRGPTTVGMFTVEV